MLIIHICYFITGTCLASFFCLCGQRCGQGQLPWHPARSYCDCCRQILQWWQLIPVCGYLIQHGRCCFCHHRLSPFHPAIECLAGLLMFQTADKNLLAAAVVSSAFAFITSTDYFYQIIYPPSLIGLLPLAVLIPSWQLPTRAEAALAIIFLIFLCLFNYYFNSIGGGDIEFIGLLFFLAGVERTLEIITCSCLVMVPFFCFAQQKQLPFLPALMAVTITIIVLLN